MRIQLIKSAVIGKKKFPVGTSMVVTPWKGEELIQSKQAKAFEGEFPPRKKPKIKLEDLKK